MNPLSFKNTFRSQILNPTPMATLVKTACSPNPRITEMTVGVSEDEELIAIRMIQEINMIIESPPQRQVITSVNAKRYLEYATINTQIRKVIRVGK